MTERPRRFRLRAGVIVPAVIAYVPLLLTSPGVVGADTKSYLTIDPDRLLSAAPWMWQPDTGLGTVTHQNIGYLWPMGPWFWAFEHLGLPDWLAQRLWLGTMLFAAAMGVRYLLRTLGWSGAGVLAASLGYMLSPYVLHYSARISVLLLPWAGLGWLIGLTAKSVKDGGWKYPALFALTIATIGSINATSLLLIGLGPFLWLVHERVQLGRTLRELVGPTLRIGVASVLGSLWWIAGLVIQSGYSLPVTRYTETYEVVADASTSMEVFRGLGYWFFYGLDKLGPWVAPSVDYTNRSLVLALSFAIPLLAVLGVVVVRWKHRAFFISLIVVGGLASVAAHPFDEPSFLGNLFKEFTRTDAGLALRSTPRAIPLLALGAAVMLGSLTRSVAQRLSHARPSIRVGYVEAAVAMLVVANLSPLWSLSMIEEQLQRDENLPEYWLDAAHYVDERDDGTRVLEVPGSDFASYRWGNTIDPITPGLIDRPFIARELVPFGSPASAALVSAFDLRMQEDTLEPEAIAPLAELLSVGDIVYRADLQYERFRTPRPRPFWAYLNEVEGLDDPVLFGDGVDHTAGPEQPMRDEIELATPADLEDPPGVAVFEVESTAPVTRTLPADRATVVIGDADGLIDTAVSGLLDTTQPVFFAASLNHDDDLAETVLSGTTTVVMTDSNRRRAQKWGGIREVVGYTETAGSSALADDPGDNRLPVFPEATDDERSVAEHRGPVVANATAYGNPVSYTPNDRPVLAFDGDPTTAWRVAAFDDPRGDRIEATFAGPTELSSMTFLQPVTGFVNRLITDIRLHFDDGSTVDASLDPDTSREGAGETVEFEPRTSRTVGVEILDTNVPGRPVYYGISAVGFAEIRFGEEQVAVDEVIRLPRRFVDDRHESLEDSPVHIVLRRLRSNPLEPVRSDPELAIVRNVHVPFDRSYETTGTARLSADATEPTIDKLLGLDDSLRGTPLETESTDYLPGFLQGRASSAFDGSSSTAWVSGYNAPEGTSLFARTIRPAVLDHLVVDFEEGPERSQVTRIDVAADGSLVAEGVPVVDGRAELELGGVPVTSLEVRLTAIDRVLTKDWYSGEDTWFPVGITSVEAGSAFEFADGPDMISDGCRDDLLFVEGEPVGLRVTGSADDAEARRPLDVSGCAVVEMPAGERRIESAQGPDTGVDIDQLAFRDTLPVDHGAQGDPPPAVVTGERRDRVEVEVAEAVDPYWLVLGQSHNDGWEANGAVVRSDPVLVNGYANGWLVDPEGAAVSVTLTWWPQRLVWIAMAISSVTIIALLFLGLRRRKGVETTAGAVPPTLETRVAAPGRSLPVALAAGLVAFLIGLLLVPDIPLVGGVVLGATTLMTLARRWRVRVPALCAFIAFGVGASYTVGQQLRHRFPPDFTWPEQFEAVHALGVIAFLLLAVEWLRSVLDNE